MAEDNGRPHLRAVDPAFLAGFEDGDPSFDDEQGGALDDAPTNAPAPSIAIDIGTVLDRWSTEGPLLHEPTGIEALDSQTGGGLVYGTTTYLQGAPDAGKTILMAQVAHELALRGVVVGLHAADESASDLVTRFAQRIGFDRDGLERREPAAIDVLRTKLAGLPIRFYDDDATIEQAVEDLVNSAPGRRCMIAVDSIQVVRCAMELLLDRELSENAAITARTKAMRRIAERRHVLAMVTSETSRAFYRSRRKEDQIDPMAAGKGSGSIEFKAKVLLTLRKVHRVPDMIDVYPTKNKLQRGEKSHIYLELNRATQTLKQTTAPADDGDEQESAEEAKQRAERNAARDAAQEAKVAALAEQILSALVQANARGAVITSRKDLLPLVRGAQSLKNDAVSSLFANGRLSGGRGKPLVPRYADAVPDGGG